jgi:hypothetical protein
LIVWILFNRFYQKMLQIWSRILSKNLQILFKETPKMALVPFHWVLSSWAHSRYQNLLNLLNYPYFSYKKLSSAMESLVFLLPGQSFSFSVFGPHFQPTHRAQNLTNFHNFSKLKSVKLDLLYLKSKFFFPPIFLVLWKKKIFLRKKKNFGGKKKLLCKEGYSCKIFGPKNYSKLCVVHDL